MMRATDATPQLVQGRKPEAVGAVDDDRVCSRHVESRFHDRRAQEYIEAPMVEIVHDLLEFPLRHLAVTDAYRRLR